MRSVHIFINVKVWSSYSQSNIFIFASSLYSHLYFTLQAKEMHEAATCQFRVEMKHGRKKPKFIWNKPSRNMTVSHLIIFIPVYFDFFRILFTCKIFSLHFACFRPSTWGNTSWYCSPNPVRQTKANWETGMRLAVGHAIWDEYVERGRKWTSRISGPRGSSWFHLIKNFYITP